jgi:hypothetical protein
MTIRVAVTVCTVLVLALGAQGSNVEINKNVAKDRVITQVVKLLQDMLTNSKAEGDEEQVAYAKYKCYCDTNEAEKKEEIAKLTETIGLLESKIEGLQASTGLLSEEVAKLDADIASNKEATKAAIALRKKENEAFVTFSEDMTEAIASMKAAIETLAEVGADQTMEKAAQGHTQYMAGFKGASMLKLQATVKKALLTAAAFSSDGLQSKKMDSFLQAPFTGTYSAQSGEVVGILKDMRDTFQRNLNQARLKEAAAQEAHEKYLKAMGDALEAMEKSFASKQSELAANDAALSSARDKLKAAKAAKEAAEDFLEKLLEMCAEKAKEYDERCMLRSQEQAAVAEAIAILNSDAAFETFGTVSATSKEAKFFLQLKAINKHSSEQDVRTQTARNLRQSKAWNKSIFLAKVASLLQAENPFAIVIAEIEKMLKLLEKEEAADDEQFEWCNKERDDNEKSLKEKKSQIESLESDIEKLINRIEDPKTGLKVLIANDEQSLVENDASQKSETATRTDENLAYQKDIANLQEATTLLTRAIQVLKVYYSKIVKEDAFLQKEDPEPPETWAEGGYKGQSAKGGTDAITMLEHILKETKTEETVAHDDELKAQHDYEDSMTELKEEQKKLEESLTQLKVDLAEAEEELLGKKAEHKATVAEKEAIEAYLLKIKPGCDFITENIDTRKANRKDEEDALKGAVKLLKDSPAYQTWVAEDHNETLGDCLEICAPNEEDVKCKACRAKVSIPGYCAGHPGTKGC